VQVSPFIGSLEEGFRGNSSVKDQEIMLQMINLYFTAPRKDETAFKAMMAQQMSLYENLLSRPEYYFLNERLKFMYEERLRGGFPTVEAMQKVDFEKAYAIYQDRFADVSDFTFIFVGNIEVESFKQLLAHYLGSIPAKQREENWKDLGIEIKKGKHVEVFRKGSEPKSAVEIMFHGDFEWNLDNRYELNTMAEVLKIMLREALREEKSGVYGVRAAASPVRYPKNKYQVNISFSCAPENTEELIKTAHREIKKLQQEGASKENLQKVKEIQRKELELGKTQNRVWLGRLQFLYENGLPLDTYDHTTDRIDKISTEDIRKAAGKYLSQENYLELKLFPEEKQAD
jgi:zinc protease